MSTLRGEPPGSDSGRNRKGLGMGTHTPLLSAREGEAAFSISAISTLVQWPPSLRARLLPEKQRCESGNSTGESVAEALQPFRMGWRQGKVEKLETCWV